MTINKKSVDIMEVIFSSLFNIESTPWSDVSYDYVFTNRDVSVILNIIPMIKSVSYTLTDEEIDEYKSLMQRIFDNIKK